MFIGFFGVILVFYSDRAVSQITAITCQEEAFLEQHPTACKHTDSPSFLLQWLDAGTVRPAQCWPQPLPVPSLPSWAQKPWGSCQLLLLGCHTSPGTSAWCKIWLLLFLMTCPTAGTAFMFADISKGGIRENKGLFFLVHFWTHFLFTFFVSFFFEKKRKQNSRENQL